MPYPSFTTRNIELVLLHLLSKKSSSGKKLTERMEKLSQKTLVLSTTYAALRKLKKEGLVVCRDLIRGKKYEITRKGRERLAFLIKLYLKMFKELKIEKRESK